MSSTLFWEPVKAPNRMLSTSTKWALKELVGWPVDTQITKADLDLLRGIQAGTSSEEVKKDIETLIDAIAKHGAIHVFEGNW